MSMVEGYNALAGSQTDINRRILRRIEALENAETGETADITSLKSDVGTLKTTVGKASGQGAGGIAKDTADLKAAVGDESTEGTILARIKALEDAE